MESYIRMNDKDSLISHEIIIMFSDFLYITLYVDRYRKQ
jgi:hypothetical protein